MTEGKRILEDSALGFILLEPRLGSDKGFYIFVLMESIVIHPESAEQLKTVKAVLRALKVQFESNSATLPTHITASIEKGMKQYEAGKSISLEEFTRKHLSE